MKNIIVITGGTGFVGSNLIEYFLNKTKLKIISIDNYSSGTKKNEFNHKRIKYISSDTKYISKIHRELKHLYKFSSNMQLHAREIGIPDIEGITLRIKAPIPKHMLNIFEVLKLSKDILN